MNSYALSDKQGQMLQFSSTDVTLDSHRHIIQPRCWLITHTNALLVPCQCKRVCVAINQHRVDNVTTHNMNDISVTKEQCSITVKNKTLHNH
jgi:hypothetical protein